MSLFCGLACARDARNLQRPKKSRKRQHIFSEPYSVNTTSILQMRPHDVIHYFRSFVCFPYISFSFHFFPFSFSLHSLVCLPLFPTLSLFSTLSLCFLCSPSYICISFVILACRDLHAIPPNHSSIHQNIQK